VLAAHKTVKALWLVVSGLVVMLAGVVGIADVVADAEPVPESCAESYAVTVYV